VNSIVLAAVLAWSASQAVKISYGLKCHGFADNPRIVWRLVWAGGMPSTHTSVVASSVTTVFLWCGAPSPLFGLVLVMAGIVIYDRSRMFKIYRTFQQRYPTFQRTVEQDPVLNDLIGHRPSELLVGLLIGLVTGSLVFLFADPM